MPLSIPARRSALRATALALYDDGFSVVPCNPDDHAAPKQPIWPKWQEQRRSREELDAALSNCRVLNIARVWGGSGLMDVECDSPEAEAALVEIFGGEIPDTVTY